MLLLSPFVVAAIAALGRLLPSAWRPTGVIAAGCGAFGFALAQVAICAAGFALAFFLASILRRRVQWQFLAEFVLAAAITVLTPIY